MDQRSMDQNTLKLIQWHYITTYHTPDARYKKGCPLSPSLFALFIEPLASVVQQNDTITGLYNPQDQPLQKMYY